MSKFEKQMGSGVYISTGEWARRHGCSRELTQAQTREIVRLVEHGGKSKSEVAKRFGVSATTITRIIELSRNHKTEVENQGCH